MTPPDAALPASAEPELAKAIDALGKRMDDLRAALLFQSLGPDRVLDFIVDDTPVRMYLPQGAAEHIQRHILLASTFFEMRLLQRVRQWIPPGSVVVDAGANIGNHTVFFALVCRAALVVAVEPQRTVFPLLERNIALNGLGNVRALNAALGAAAGQAAIGPTKPGNAGATQFSLGDSGGYPVTTIDALGLDRLDFLKLDVEGSHLAVLDGARETLRRTRPRIWVELRPQHGEVEAGEAALKAIGYVRMAMLSRNDYVYQPL